MRRLLVALAFIGATLSCSREVEGPGEPVSPDPVVSVVTVAARRHDVELRLTGAIESRHDAVVSAEVAGRVVERPAPEGALIDAGQAVILLEETSHRLNRDLARVVAEEAALHPDVPASERATAELRLEVAQDRLDRCRIAAPMKATIETLHVEVGEWVNVGMPVARLVDYESLRLIVRVGEDVAVKLGNGTAVRFNVDAHGPIEFGAVVARIGRAADETTGKFDVELHVVEAPAPLFVGMFARVRLPMDREREIIRLARKAIRSRFGETSCFVLATEGEHHVARERLLRIAPMVGDPTHVEVITGLESGDVVITGPFTGLRDGVRVRTGETR